MSRLAPAVQDAIAAEIKAAQGREVCFAARLDSDGTIVEVRVSARGTAAMVLAVPGFAARGDMLIHNHPSGNLEPSRADLDVAARLAEEGIGFGIVDNLAARLYVVVEVARRSPELRLDPFQVIELLGERGPVAGVLGQYEDRPSQRDMAAHISDCYNDGGIALLEAGTGVGKSFAYLVPALEWARQNRERTVVSTNTINLQEQLVGKDLPLLQRALGSENHLPTFALLKGWRNYLCLARLRTAYAGSAQGALLESEHQGQLTVIAEWATRTADGSLTDLSFTPAMEVWDEIAAEPDLCTRQQCAHFDNCFLFRARRRAAQADVIVVNHHLLAADLAVRQASDNWLEAAVLPPYQRLILDEAHHLEDVAAHHLGLRVTSHGIRRLLARFERNGRGLIPALAAELAGGSDLLTKANQDLLMQSIIPAVAGARRAADQLSERIALVVDGVGGGACRFDDEFDNNPVWGQGLSTELTATLAAFNEIGDSVETIADRMSQGEMTERQQQLVVEMRGVVRRLKSSADALQAALRRSANPTPAVRWAERTGPKGQQVALHAVPLDLAPLLRELIFDRLRTVVLTSATLATTGGFDFFESRVGLSGSRSPVTVREILPSPFDYGAQCLLAIPNDLPDPRNDEPAHDAAIAGAVQEIAWASDGGIFALFTSHGAMRRAARELRSILDPRWPLLVQGEAPRDQLLARFKEAGNAILLGTDSFWEGVDVPGRALRALLICKLPFKVPSEPLTAARLERLAGEGEDGFTGYLLPLAALKLKQGFGRLIRSRGDVGVVVVLDSRMVTRRYGTLLLRGLPPADKVVGSWAQIRTRCEDFFARHQIGAAS